MPKLSKLEDETISFPVAARRSRRSNPRRIGRSMTAIRRRPIITLAAIYISPKLFEMSDIATRGRLKIKYFAIVKPERSTLGACEEFC